MRFGIEEGILLTNLDAKGFDILNCPYLESENTISTIDPALSDPRVPPTGSVTNESVANDAAIAQSKLAFDDPMPGEWIGTDPGLAAPGELVEHISNKNVINGYAGLGTDGKMPPGTVPVSGTGTVTEVKFVFPPELSVIHSLGEVVISDDTPLTIPGLKVWLKADALLADLGPSDKIATVQWNAAPPESWFGVHPITAGPGTPYPRFNKLPFPEDMIPVLDAAKVTSGIVANQQLPPDEFLSTPGDGMEGHESDYYARDGTYKPMKAVSYQPTLPDPAITVAAYQSGVANINLTSSTPGVTFFANSNPTLPDTFIEVTKQPLKATPGKFLSVYTAKIGWSNSNIVTYEIPDSPLMGFDINAPPPL